MNIEQSDLFAKPSASKTKVATPAEILDTTRQMLGGLAPYLSFGVAQHEAWLKTSLIGSTPDLDRCIRKATRHLETVDPTNEAVAAVHAGMVLVAALKVGIAAEDAGVIATTAVCDILGIKDVVGEPEMDY